MSRTSRNDGYASGQASLASSFSMQKPQQQQFNAQSSLPQSAFTPGQDQAGFLPRITPSAPDMQRNSFAPQRYSAPYQDENASIMTAESGSDYIHGPGKLRDFFAEMHRIVPPGNSRSTSVASAHINAGARKRNSSVGMVDADAMTIPKIYEQQRRDSKASFVIGRSNSTLPRNFIFPNDASSPERSTEPIFAVPRMDSGASNRPAVQQAFTNNKNNAFGDNSINTQASEFDENNDSFNFSSTNSPREIPTSIVNADARSPPVSRAPKAMPTQALVPRKVSQTGKAAARPRSLLSDIENAYFVQEMQDELPEQPKSPVSATNGEKAARVLDRLNKSYPKEAAMKVVAADETVDRPPEKARVERITPMAKAKVEKVVVKEKVVEQTPEVKERPPTAEGNARCPHCSRQFNQDRVERHMNVCDKREKPQVDENGNPIKARKVVDGKTLRTKGTELEQYIKKQQKTNKKGSKSKPVVIVK